MLSILQVLLMTALLSDVINLVRTLDDSTFLVMLSILQVLLMTALLSDVINLVLTLDDSTFLVMLSILQVLLMTALLVMLSILQVLLMTALLNDLSILYEPLMHPHKINNHFFNFSASQLVAQSVSYYHFYFLVRVLKQGFHFISILIGSRFVFLIMDN